MSRIVHQLPKTLAIPAQSRQAKKPSRAKNLSRRRSKNIPFCNHPKSVASFRYPASSKRGVRVVTNVEAGCGGRERGSGRLARARTAKPCGPGAATLALSERNDPLMTGAKEPGPRGELGVSR